VQSSKHKAQKIEWRLIGSFTIEQDRILSYRLTSNSHVCLHPSIRHSWFTAQRSGRNARSDARNSIGRGCRCQHGAGGFRSRGFKDTRDGPQALKLSELPWFLEDVQLAREAFEKRIALAERHQDVSDVVPA